MKRTLAVALLFAFLLGCQGGGGGGGGGNGSGGTRPTLETTTAASDYLEATAPRTHDTYESDAESLEGILTGDGQLATPYACQTHFDLIVTDSSILPVLAVEYVRNLQGNKSRTQLVAAFEEMRPDEEEYYVAQLKARYDGWGLPLPPETAQALRDAIAGNYTAAEEFL